jgi:hypothetical protein
VNLNSTERNTHEYEGSEKRHCIGKIESSKADVNSVSCRSSSVTKKDISCLVVGLRSERASRTC